MTGRELLLDAVRGRATSRPAWLPFVGCHGGRLIGRGAAEYLQSADRVVQGLTTAVGLYRPDGLPVMFDLQIEAEILGCRLHWAEEVPPSVIAHPLEEAGLDALPKFDAGAGRMPVALGALQTLRRRFGDETAFYGLLCGPFTLAAHLRGNSLFLDMFDEPARVDDLLATCAGVARETAAAYLAAGADVIAVVDPMVSQISPEDFTRFVAPALDNVFDFIRGRGGLSSLFVCGDVSRNLEAMSRTKTDNLSVDEQIPIPRLRQLCEAAGKSFGGNLRLTAVLLLGEPDDARKEAIDVLDAAGPRGFVLAPGCDLPYATPAANLQAVADMVHDAYARDVARTSLATRAVDTFDDVAVPDYGSADGVVVDVITLDSTSCAPCQYMMEAVRRAATASGCRCYINEHKIKVRQGLGMMMKLGVKNLPTICIDGEVCFASIIPDPHTLSTALREAAGRRGHGHGRA
jgi:uroporphyrinogen decarboxylase